MNTTQPWQPKGCQMPGLSPLPTSCCSETLALDESLTTQSIDAAWLNNKQWGLNLQKWLDLACKNLPRLLLAGNLQEAIVLLAQNWRMTSMFVHLLGVVETTLFAYYNRTSAVWRLQGQRTWMQHTKRCKGTMTGWSLQKLWMRSCSVQELKKLMFLGNLCSIIPSPLILNPTIVWSQTDPNSMISLLNRGFGGV